MGREEDKAKVSETSLAGQFAESANFVTRPIKYYARRSRDKLRRDKIREGHERKEIFQN
jgi:hypothetical protein